MTEIIVLTLFIVKHFFVDFVWQTQEEINYKGTYLDYRGIKHSVKHGLSTMGLIWIVGVGFETSYLLGALDFLIHYHIDWVKMNMSKNFTPVDRAFWIWLGFDQMLHYLTYILFIAIIVS